MRFLFILVTLSVLGIGSVQAQDTKGARYDNSKKPKQLTPEQEAQAEFDKLPAEQKRVLLEVQEEIEREKYSDTKKNKGVKKPEKASAANGGFFNFVRGVWYTGFIGIEFFIIYVLNPAVIVKTKE